MLVALPGARLGAEAALQPARPHARRRAAGLRVAGAAALTRPVAVATRLDALGLALLLGEVRRPWGVAEALLRTRLRGVREVLRVPGASYPA